MLIPRLDLPADPLKFLGRNSRGILEHRFPVISDLILRCRDDYSWMRSCLAPIHPLDSLFGDISSGCGCLESYPLHKSFSISAPPAAAGQAANRFPGISSATDIPSQEFPHLFAVGEEKEMVGTWQHTDLGIAACLLDC